MVAEKVGNSKVHTFGFGSGADKDLVIWLAKKGNGSHSLMSDTSLSNLNTQVIRALKTATAPCYTDLKVEWKEIGS